MKGLAGCALVLLLVCLRASAGAEQIPRRPERLALPPFHFEIPEVERRQLRNGVPVYVVEDRTVPLVDVVLALRTGGRYDPEDGVGLASLTASMLRRGGTVALAADQFDEEVDFLGAELDSFGGVDRSGMTLECSPGVLERALALFAEALLRPRFQEDRLDSAKANLRKSLEARGDDPLRVLDLEWQLLQYGPKHPRARQLTGRGLAAIARQDLLDFHRRHWAPDTAVLAVSGDVDTEHVLELLDRLLGDWGGESAGDAAPAPPPLERVEAPAGLYHLESSTPQAKLYLGHRGKERRSWEEQDAFAAMVMAEILGGGGTVSRLRSRLRAEEGLAYRVVASFGLGIEEPGSFEVFLETSPRRAGPAVRAVLAELERLRSEPVPPAELELAQRSLVDALPLLFQGAVAVAGRFAEDELLGRPHQYWRIYRQRIERVRPQDVTRLARAHLHPAELRVLVMGPWSEIGAGEHGGPGLEQVMGRPVTHLPSRDPVELD